MEPHLLHKPTCHFHSHSAASFPLTIWMLVSLLATDNPLAPQDALCLIRAPSVANTSAAAVNERANITATIEKKQDSTNRDAT